MSKHSGPYVTRFDLFNRVSHTALMLAFLGLALTGLPLLFSNTRWAYWLARALGGFAAAGALHRFFAIILTITFAAHVMRLFYRVAIRRERGILWGPTSFVPQLRDLKELIGHMKFFLGMGPRPRFDRYTYWEKFDYWAVFWGMFIIGGSGFILWFPTVFGSFLPGWVLNLAEIIHGEEALLAVGFIFTVHFFNGHLRPDKFPMDMVMFTGRMPKAEMEEERPDEYERMVATGKLASLEAPAPSAEVILVWRVVGAIAVILGLGLVLLILFAALFY